MLYTSTRDNNVRVTASKAITDGISPDGGLYIPVEIPALSADDIKALCGGAGTDRGTGGMITKIHAAEIATQAGIPTVVMNGTAPQDIYKLIDGHSIGTLFTAK